MNVCTKTVHACCAVSIACGHLPKSYNYYVVEKMLLTN